MSTSPIQETIPLTAVEQLPNIEPEVQSTRGGSRSFKVKLEPDGSLYGRYNGDSPYQAANKALSEIVRTREKNGQIDDSEISFFLVESTKNSSRKQHQYVGRRIKLDVPIEYPVANGILIKKEHKNFLRKVKRTASTLTVPVEALHAATTPQLAGQQVGQVAGQQVGQVAGQVNEPTVLSSNNTSTDSTVSVSV